MKQRKPRNKSVVPDEARPDLLRRIRDTQAAILLTAPNEDLPEDQGRGVFVVSGSTEDLLALLTITMERKPGYAALMRQAVALFDRLTAAN